MAMEDITDMQAYSHMETRGDAARIEVANIFSNPSFFIHLHLSVYFTNDQYYNNC